MSTKMLGEWSPEYVEALSKSNRADDPLFGRFPSRASRDGFVGRVRARKYADLEVERLSDGVGVEIRSARASDLLEIVQTAETLGGEVLFPGALPA